MSSPGARARSSRFGAGNAGEAHHSIALRTTSEGMFGVTTQDDVGSTPLRRGSRVRVADAAAILATLDENGRLDGLPLMPEMLKWAGDTLEVSARADKACDTIKFDGRRRMKAAVHLGGIRCDGSAHGGCRPAACSSWKRGVVAPRR